MADIDIKKTKSQLIEELKSLQRRIQRLEKRKKVEKSIFQAKREWENTFDTVKDLIFITDKDGSVKQANRSLADKLGVQPKDLIGKKCWEIFRCNHKRTDACSLIKIKQGLSVREHKVEIPFLGMWVFAHVYAAYTPSKYSTYG